jgi:hypothetical protein
MANAGDGERPRLPDTDDPYVLLGVATDADTDAIRKAYARLIKIYRPDRSPAEFQRIHAAYQEAKPRERPAADGSLSRVAMAREYLGAPSSTEATAGRPRDGEPPARAAMAQADASGSGASEARDATDPERERAAAVARRLDDACERAERGDHAGAAAIVDALLDERAPLDALAQRPDHTRLVVRHPSLSWTRLVHASNDRDAIRVIWNLAWLAAYPDDPDRARVLLDDDRLRLDAADDLHLAAVCLVRISGLAWGSAAKLSALLARYRQAIPPHPALDDLLESTALEIEGAANLHGAMDGTANALLAPLRALFAAAHVGDRASRRAAAGAVIAALERDLDATLRDLDALLDDVDLQALFEAIYTYLPVDATRLDRLDKVAFNELTSALHDIGREPHKWKVVGGVIGATALIGKSSGLLGLGVFAAAVGLFAGTERLRYRRRIRPRLARLLLQLPVTTWVVSRWIRINGRLNGRLARFDLAIDADRALYALSMFASAAITIGELGASAEPVPPAA